MPPAPNAFVVGTTRTGSHGQFRLTTSKRVDRLAARTDDFREIGELANVRTQDNVIHITKR